MKNIPARQLRLNPLTTTLYAVDSNFENLVTSVALFGVLEPLIVFPLPEADGVYQIVSGNRRFKAAEQIGLDEVPCTIIDPVELRQRFNDDNELRKSMDKQEVPIDEHLLSAMTSGLPECAGVALGLDRLLMLACDKMHIKEVMSFTTKNA